MNDREFPNVFRPRVSRMSLRLTAGAVALALLLPVVVAAQEAAADRPGTHQVREGDTLWDIARTYLGDPFLWPEIYRINTNVVEDPHWIYPGEILRLPGGTESSPIVATDESYTPQVATGPTVFASNSRNVAAVNSNTLVARRTPPPSIRRGEILAAPYVDREGGPSGAGQILESSEVYATPRETKRRFTPDEIVYLRPPTNAAPSTGTRYMAYELGPLLPGVGQVIVPTGIIEVEIARTGEASTGRIVQMFDEVKRGQHLLAMDTIVVPPSNPARPVASGPQGRIVWIQNNPVLASLQHYIVLDATSGDGVRLGDHFTLQRRPHVLDGGDRLPAENVAIAQAVRVTRYGTTAIIVGQRHAAIQEGQHARVTARLP